MSYAHCDRLSALDASFLAVEDAHAHMHIGSVSIFDAGPLTRPEGGLDFEQVLEFAAAQLHKAPRFRQKIAYVPGFGQPVWIDDGTFNLTYHVRHASLPVPGDVRQLKRLAGRIMSQQLDRGKPLWEVWLVEGVEGNRFAVISKIHHCMSDGLSGVDVMNMLMGPDPHYRARTAPRWVPRPAPSGSQMLVGELRRRLASPLEIARGEPARPGETWKRLASTRDALRGLLDVASTGLAPMQPTPLNVDIGPHRRIDWTRLDLDEVREIRARSGGKLNDVVLAVVSGALRRFLKQRGVQVDGLEFRAALPVNLRSQAERGRSLGNRVSGLVAGLPLDESDPWKRLLRIIDMTRELKRSGQSVGGELLERLIEFVPYRPLARLERWGARHQAANIVITNVPGPTVPIYLLGAPMQESYPVVPLAPNLALGVALFSYDRGLFWGLNSDWDAVPDLHDFIDEIGVQFEALRKAGMTASPSRDRKAPSSETGIESP